MFLLHPSKCGGRGGWRAPQREDGEANGAGGQQQQPAMIVDIKDDDLLRFLIRLGVMVTCLLAPPTWRSEIIGLA